MTHGTIDDSKRYGNTAVICVLLLIALLIPYAVGYLVPVSTSSIGPHTIRVYRNESLAKSFYPAAWIEAKLIRKPVDVYSTQCKRPDVPLYIVEP